MSQLTAFQLLAKLSSQNFKLKDLSFNGFDSIQASEFTSLLVVNSEDDKESGNTLDIWADFSLAYDGEPPDSYRALNTIIMDWVDNNEDDIKKEVNPHLKEYLTSNFPDIDLSDLDENFDDYIWEDQVDYYPEIDEENKQIKFSIELVLELEEDDGEDSEDSEEEGKK
jgi:hypothetical protein